MSDTLDLLQIKIEKARAQLPEITRRAIDAVPWKTIILAMKTKGGYSFEQLGDLETETELLLCGLLNLEDYPKELEKRMGVPKAQVDVLINDMNELVFKKIREEMIKNSELEKKDEKNLLETKTQTSKIITPQTKTTENSNFIVPQKPKQEIHPILAQKLTGSFQVPATKTEHTLNNLSKTRELPSGTEAPEITKKTTSSVPYPPKKDPYRLSPEE